MLVYLFRYYLLPIIACVILMIESSTGQMKKVSMIVYNTSIYSMDDSNRLYQAMAIDRDRIIEVGRTEKILSKYTSEKKIEAKGKFIFPGFIDAHAHLLGLGEEQMNLDLSNSSSLKEIQSMVRRRAGTIGKKSWILGRGWDQNKWNGHQFSNHAVLDSAAAFNPVYLKRVDGHAGWANAAAMKLCNITKETKDPPGGKLLRDAKGEPTGIFLDNAMDLIRNKIPPYTEAELEQMYSLAIRECLKVGLTEVHDMGIDRPKIAAIKNMIRKKIFPFRIYAMIDGVLPEWHELLKTGKQTFGNKQFILGGLKLYADGALGSRGALLSHPYSDDLNNSGLLITPEDSIFHETKIAVEKGLQVCVHAIGDRANHIVLNAFESVIKSNKIADLRLRIEHVQVLSGDDFERFSKLQIIASMQPTHCTSDMYWAEARLGADRVKGAYAWNSLLKSGARLAGGSDFPVERPDPLLGIYAAATRRDRTNIPSSQQDIDEKFQLADDSRKSTDRYSQGWYGNERLSRIDAVKMFTAWAAYASFQEKEKGTIAPNTFADFVILDKDIMTIPEQEILRTKVLSTFIGGIEEYRAETSK